VKYKIENDWLAEYEVTDKGRKRLEKYDTHVPLEEALGNYEFVAISFLVGMEREGKSAQEIHEELKTAFSDRTQFHLRSLYVGGLGEDKFKLIDLVFHSLVTSGLIVKIDDLPLAFKPDFGEYE